jgi:Leucine-rich repeat (LRR) protein
MPNLESIKGIGYLSPEGMKTLGTLRSLKCLHVSLKGRFQNYHGPTGTSDLAGLSKLEELALSGDYCLSDADLVPLESLSNLRDLQIGFDGVTDRGMSSLCKLPRLEHLTVSTDGGMSKRGLNELNGLTNLQTLSVKDNHLWLHPDAKPEMDEIRLNLAPLKSLKTLDLAGFALEEGDLASLSGLHQLEWLTLQNKTIPETALRGLKDLPALKNLQIEQITCSDGSGLASLAGLTGLRDLTLRGRVTDYAFSQLAGVTSACSLSAWTNDPIRPATIAYLKQTLPVLESIHLEPLPEVNSRGVQPPPRQQGLVRRGPLRQR